MYKVHARIKGTAPLLQHKFAIATLDTLQEGATKKTGATDYSMEWLETMYTHDGLLVQPSTHLEGSLVKAAVSFRIKGAGRKTYKDAMRAYCYVVPEFIPHLHNGGTVAAPGPELLINPTDHLSVSVMRVKVQRAAVARSRLMVATGWELAFEIEVHDEQVRPDIVETILTEAGRAVGIGDFRPRFGRFELVGFEVVNSAS